ncbi:MAG: replicative DNA helicase, partial [Ruminiclostridium sp.]|nr:replicative DNA helicase [Ruminiclostridium sp.]
MADFDISDANLPFNIDAEQIVLGSLIIDSSLISRLSGKLTPDHFHIRVHSKIFDVIQRLFLGGDEINIVSVTEHCMRQSVFETVDEARTYLFKLTDTSVEKSSIESYAEILDEKFIVRRLILAS